MEQLSEAEQKWSQRLERERKARRQAEQHAEQGLRELWLANQQLESAVSERTAELDRSLAALEFAVHTQRLLLADIANEAIQPIERLAMLIGGVDEAPLPTDVRQAAAQGTADARSMLDVLVAAARVDAPRPQAEVESRSPQTIVDELVRRWQIPSARRGKLLTPDVRSAEDPVALVWQTLIGAADAVLDGAVQHSGPGTLAIELSVTPDDVTICIVDAGMAMPHLALTDESPTAVRWLSHGERCLGIAVAQRMVDGTTCSLTVGAGADDSTSITIRSQRPRRN